MNSTLAKTLLEKYPLPDNVDMVVPTVNPEIWADLPSTVEKRLRSGQKMYHAAMVPMLQACSSLTTAVKKGEGLSPAQTAALLTQVMDSCTLAIAVLFIGLPQSTHNFTHCDAITTLQLANRGSPCDAIVSY